MNKGIEIRVIKNSIHPHSKLAVFIEEIKDNKYYLPNQIEMKESERVCYESINPSLLISDFTAQQLIDDLWGCGFRPSEGSGSAGALVAVQNHLNDMRKIVFSKLKIGENSNV